MMVRSLEASEPQMSCAGDVRGRIVATMFRSGSWPRYTDKERIPCRDGPGHGENPLVAPRWLKVAETPGEFAWNRLWLFTIKDRLLHWRCKPLAWSERTGINGDRLQTPWVL